MTEYYEKTSEQQNTKPRKKREVSCRDYALNLLNRQAHSSGNLKQKLERKGYLAEDISAVLEDMKELGFIKDEEYAQTYFENLKKYRNFGYFEIKKKLMDKKIDKRYIDTLLETLTPSIELEIAKRFVSKAKNKTYEQKARMLQSRGFRSQAVFGAIQKEEQ